ncbi:MAG: 30S ribosomal protein S16 [Candidatus Caenarcaniphilales bacterium]|nr:30S ribosomal protein S16 [Candidatus Caenarcaniphilales bacterium]
MSTKIRLKRTGRKKRPFYRIIVIDSREKRDGCSIEDIGWFDPIKDAVYLNSERFDYWTSVGAIPSDRVSSLSKQKATSSK